MHTALTRANALAAYTMSVLASLTFLCFLSTFFNEYQVHADINTVKVVVKNVPDYAAGKEKNDLGFLTFDLQADLNPLFNWNVKQLFLYLTAEYETPNNQLNQVRFIIITKSLTAHLARAATISMMLSELGVQDLIELCGLVLSSYNTGVASFIQFLKFIYLDHDI